MCDRCCRRLFIRVESRVKKVLYKVGFNSQNRCFLVDQTFIYHIHRNIDGGFSSSLSVSGLQHEQFPVLNGELHVLHICIVLLQLGSNLFELCIHFREGLCHLGNLLRRPDAGYHVFALCVDQEFTVEDIFSRRRVSGEGNAGAGIIPFVSEHHGLYVDSSSQILRDVVQFSVQDRPVISPGTEDRFDGFHQLLLRILREFASENLYVQFFVSLNNILQIFSLQVNIELCADFCLLAVKNLVELLHRDFHYNIAEHLQKSSVAVIGKSFIICLLRQRDDSLVIQTEVQNRIHHARHGDRRSGTNGNQQGILRISKLLSHDRFQLILMRFDLFNDAVVDFSTVCIILFAGVCRNGESKRHRHAGFCHLSQIRSLSAEQGSHVLGTLVE